MKSLKFALTIVVILTGIQSFAQNYTRQRDWVIAPMYGLGAVIPPSVRLISGTEAPKPAFGVSSYQGELVKSDGTVYTRNYRTNLWGFETYYRWKERHSENRWAIGISAAWQRQVFKLEHPFSFSYKGHNLVSTVWNFNYLRTGLIIRRTWMKDWSGIYAQVAGYYSNLFYMNTANGREKIEERTGGYLEGGTGYRTKTYNLKDGVPLIVPEIGMQIGENSGVELSLAYYHPLTPLLQTESTFYRNSQEVGVSRINITQNVLMLNLKLPITISHNRENIRKNRVKSEPKLKKVKTSKVKKTAPPPAPQPEPKVTTTTTPYDGVKLNNSIVLENLYFELTKSDLLESSYRELDRVVEWMNANPSVEIRLEGHTDKIGDADKNLILSRDRVNAVREYLIKKGIRPIRITTKGYGDTRLVCKPSPCEKNRRVEMVITKR
ncbi:OmpA family protein [Runella sp. MFBS21]|uniref:OmpA family protein n=1 Tax=Runella sp. MFBS21 TaxID=3034018 RepID=UPI0023F8B071|nr:OmpA family protein [Runella sp. MFBS21]MDF7816434.1 OmpA family protein [Runella sp. MFBS21]